MYVQEWGWNLTLLNVTILLPTSKCSTRCIQYFYILWIIPQKNCNSKGTQQHVILQDRGGNLFSVRGHLNTCNITHRPYTIVSLKVRRGHWAMRLQHTGKFKHRLPIEAANIKLKCNSAKELWERANGTRLLAIPLFAESRIEPSIVHSTLV